MHGREEEFKSLGERRNTRARVRVCVCLCGCGCVFVCVRWSLCERAAEYRHSENKLRRGGKGGSFQIPLLNCRT